MPNITNIPAPRVPLVDPQTGIISNEWYRYLLNLFVLTGAGGNNVSLDDLQVGPPPQESVSTGGGSGSVNSVTGSAPISSTGGVNPNISISQSSSTTNGYLSSTDWNTFNNKLAAMVYPGAGIPNSTGSAWGTSYATTGTGTNVVLQNSPTISSPTIDGVAPYINFGNGSATTLAAGRMWYNELTGSWNLGMGGGNITQQVGEELFVYGKATAAISGNTIVQAIYQTGTVGASGAITFAPTVSGITNGDLIIGVATEDIALNGFGRATSVGVIHGIDTTGSTYGETWVDGDTLWYNPVTGGVTKVKPVAPNIKVQLGTVINAGSGGSGSLQVEITHGSVLGGTDSNVQLTSPTAAQILTYSTTDGYWKNTSLTSGTGISTNTNANGTLTVTNTAPDQTVAITGAGGAVVTGTYPNFTITTPSGTVTSVTGTSPIASTGGATPAISISQATTSTNGYLSSIDWNTFNNKQPAGTYVTSVGATSPVTSTGGVTPTVALAASYGDTQNPYASKTANYFLAAPNGSAGAPTFRAMVAADVPTLNQNTTGTASNVTGVVAIANGGTGQTTKTAGFDALSPTTTQGDLIYNNGTNNVRLPIGANTYVLTSNGTTVSWSAPAAGGSNITPQGMWENNKVISSNYSITSGNNAITAGPITVNSGVSVTVPSGSRWIVA